MEKKLNAHEAYPKRCVTTPRTATFGNYERQLKNKLKNAGITNV
jgi:hypothetical protein